MGRVHQAVASGWLSGIFLVTFMLLSVVGNDVQDSQTALVPHPTHGRRPLARFSPQLLVGKIDGSVSSVDAENGNILWTFDSGSPLISSSRGPDSNIQVFPGIDGSVYVLADDRSPQLELSHVTVSKLVENSPSLTDDGSIILGSQTGTLYYLNSETGKVLKTVSFDDASKMDSVTPVEDNVLVFARKDYKAQSFAKTGSSVRWSMSFSEIHHLDLASVPNRRALVEYLKGKQDLAETYSVNGPTMTMGTDNSLHAKDPKTGWKKWSVSFNSAPVVVYTPENSGRNILSWDSSCASAEGVSVPISTHPAQLWPGTRGKKINSRVIVGTVSSSGGGLYALPAPAFSPQDNHIEQFQGFDIVDKKLLDLFEGKGDGEMDSLKCVLDVVNTSDRHSALPTIPAQTKQGDNAGPDGNTLSTTALIGLTIVAGIVVVASIQSRRKMPQEDNLRPLERLSRSYSSGIVDDTEPIPETCDGSVDITEDGVNKGACNAQQRSQTPSHLEREIPHSPLTRQPLRSMIIQKETKSRTTTTRRNKQILNKVERSTQSLEYSARNEPMVCRAQNKSKSINKIVDPTSCPSPMSSIHQRLPTQEEIFAWSAENSTNLNSVHSVVDSMDDMYRILGRSLLNEVNEPSAFDHFDQRFGQPSAFNAAGGCVSTLAKPEDTFDLTPTHVLSSSPIHANWGSAYTNGVHPFTQGYLNKGTYSPQQCYYQQYLNPLTFQGMSATSLAAIQGGSSLGSKSLNSFVTLNPEKFSFSNFKEGTRFSVGKLTVGPGVLGYGTAGTIVFEGELQGRQVAVKRILKTFCDMAANEKDILILSDEHPNLVRLFAVEEDKDFIFLALERCQMSLSEFINSEEGRLSLIEDGRPSKKCLKILLDISEGLCALHSRGVVHRDLKPHNILMTESLKAKLSDMGLGRRLVQDQSSFFSVGSGGSSGWQAPEQLIIRQGGAARQSKAMDVFSLGCVMYHCISGGRHPFGESSYTRDDNILKQHPHLDALDELPEDKDLISAMLEKDPEKRPTIEEVKEHPFWWNSRKKLNFLIELSDRVENEDRQEDKTLFRAFEDVSSKAIGGNWGARLDPLLVTNLGQYRKYTFTSLRDLLRVVRNKHNHYRELPASLKQAMGAIPDGFCNYFVSRFPNLLMTTYTFVKEHLVLEAPMDKYFQATLEKRTSNADSLSSPSSMPAIEEEINFDLDPSRHASNSEEDIEGINDEVEDDNSPNLQVRTKPVMRTISGDSVLSGGTGTPWDAVLNVIMENANKDSVLQDQGKEVQTIPRNYSPLRSSSEQWTSQPINDAYLSARTPARSPNSRSHPRGFDSLINTEREPRLEVDVKQEPVDPYRELQSPIRLSEGSKKYEDPTRPIVGWEEDLANQNYTLLPFPRRPGSAVCDFYQKTGFCKYHDRCRFHHPPECAVRLNEDGLPLRKGEQVCEFYKNTHQCKFGGACKFNHPNMRPIYAGSLNHS